MYSRKLLGVVCDPKGLINKGQLQNSWLASSQVRLPVQGAAGEWCSQLLCREQVMLACPRQNMSLHLSRASGRFEHRLLLGNCDFQRLQLHLPALQIGVLWPAGPPLGTPCGTPQSAHRAPVTGQGRAGISRAPLRRLRPF